MPDSEQNGFNIYSDPVLQFMSRYSCLPSKLEYRHHVPLKICNV